MLKTILGRWLIALSLVVAAGQAGAAEPQPYKLDVMLPLTGLGSFLGGAEQAAMKIMQKLVNKSGGIKGQPVEFVFHDDESNPQIGVQLADQILAGKPQVLLGSSIVAVCNATAPLMRNGPVEYCFSPAIHPKSGSFVFTSGVSSSDTYAVIIRYFRLRGWTRLAMIASTDASGQDAERGVAAAMKLAENNDVKMAVAAHFNPTDVSIAAQTAQIAAAKPDAILVLTSGTPAATVFKGLIQAGIDLPVATPYSNMTYAQMRAYGAFLPKQLYFPSGEWPHHGAGMVLDPAVDKVQAEFYDAFTAAGTAPDVAATLAWDPTLIVIAALRQLGPDATAEQLRTYLARLDGFAGLNGLYDFKKAPQRGLDEADVVMTEWRPETKRWEIVSKPTGIPLAK